MRVFLGTLDLRSSFVKLPAEIFAPPTPKRQFGAGLEHSTVSHGCVAGEWS